jgi:hypothetical protein
MITYVPYSDDVEPLNLTNQRRARIIHAGAHPVVVRLAWLPGEYTDDSKIYGPRHCHQGHPRRACRRENRVPETEPGAVKDPASRDQDQPIRNGAGTLTAYPCS